MVYIFFDKKSSGHGVATEPNYQLANKLHRQIIRKFKRQKFYSSFRDNIWRVDLADMQSISKYNKGMKYLLCAIDLFSKWDAPLKDQKGITIVNVFQKIISRVRKPNKVWVDQGGEFYNKLFKRFLKINNIEMYSTYNKGKSIDAETFIRALKNKIFKHMTAVSQYVYSDMLDDVVNRYNNAVHRTIKMKPIDVTSDPYDECNKDSNETKPKFKVGDDVKISKHKNIFSKGYTQNLPEEVFVVNKTKIQFRGHA